MGMPVHMQVRRARRQSGLEAWGSEERAGLVPRGARDLPHALPFRMGGGVVLFHTAAAFCQHFLPSLSSINMSENAM